MAHIDVDAVLAKLNNTEKASLLAGETFWATKGLPQHGIPSLRLSDGPNGVRGSKFFNGTPSACFPCGTALGATWNVDLLHEAGVLMGAEAKAKGVHVVLGPTVNMQRSPLGGRGFESLAEDPLLSGKGAAALVNGVQSTGIAATIKHFVCNDQEHMRRAYDARVTDRALREIYLKPFEIVVRESNPYAFMTAYNKLNGTHCSHDPALLKTLLRGEWGWEGLVMSDWFGTYSTKESLEAGLDLEMPGPSRWRADHIAWSIQAGNLAQHTLDERAREVLRLVSRCAGSGIPENAPETAQNNTPETAAFLRKIGQESMVLMKNDNNVLPFSKEKKTLVVGPNVKTAVYHGGGSASLQAYYAVTPYDGISSKLSKTPTYTLGADAYKELPLIGQQLKNAYGKPGVLFKVYNDSPSVKDRECIDEIALVKTEMFLMDYVQPKIKSKLWYATVEGYMIAVADAKYQLGLCVYGTANLYVNDELIIDNETTQVKGSAFFGNGTVEEKGYIDVKAGQRYDIRVEFASAVTSKLLTNGTASFGNGGIRIGGATIVDADAEINAAVRMAKEADQVIMCVGLNADWETEGSDRETMDLPGHLDRLISTVSEANVNTVVIMQSGTPVTMPWLSKVPALVQAWYGGNETGNAIADVIFGDYNPSGRTPLTFPHRLEDNPAYLHFRCDNGRTLYGEDIYMGYRFYEKTGRPVAFPFGHGLSYTTFEYANLNVSATQGQKGILQVQVEVRNTGSLHGGEVVQLYIEPIKPPLWRPKRELKDFRKIHLQKGESKAVIFKTELKHALAFWDENGNAWRCEAGRYRIWVGGNVLGDGAGKYSLNGEVIIENGWSWTGL
ncbi:related to beta-glucosidase [Phialocephala subalpina]|uniref:beta-glucosidase n=1 Tax=Phialocephala subalpina TaxID=576137 RepID=A0A1L7X9R4_9HELO|nr:related to beta-glucosidase [Phialocephala subalpina]